MSKRDVTIQAREVQTKETAKETKRRGRRPLMKKVVANSTIDINQILHAATIAHTSTLTSSDTRARSAAEDSTASAALDMIDPTHLVSRGSSTLESIERRMVNYAKRTAFAEMKMVKMHKETAELKSICERLALKVADLEKRCPPPAAPGLGQSAAAKKRARKRVRNIQQFNAASSASSSSIPPSIRPLPPYPPYPYPYGAYSYAPYLHPPPSNMTDSRYHGY